jgi:hypothetical protein
MSAGHARRKAAADRHRAARSAPIAPFPKQSEIAAAATAFERAIRETVFRLKVLESRAAYVPFFKRVIGGRGISFVPFRIEADGLTYNRSRATRALAIWTYSERRAFVKALRASTDATDAARRARTAFAKAWSEAKLRDAAWQAQGKN